MKIDRSLEITESFSDELMRLKRPRYHNINLLRYICRGLNREFKLSVAEMKAYRVQKPIEVLSNHNGLYFLPSPITLPLLGKFCRTLLTERASCSNEPCGSYSSVGACPYNSASRRSRPFFPSTVFRVYVPSLPLRIETFANSRPSYAEYSLFRHGERVQIVTRVQAFSSCITLFTAFTSD